MTDQVGTERVRFASTGGIVESCISLPFGDALQCTGTDPDPYHFAKLERDAESGDDHAQHRDYNSIPGHWLSPDPAGVDVASLTDPQTWNLYAYSDNNPVTDNDPTGLAPCTHDGPCYEGILHINTNFGNTPSGSWCALFNVCNAVTDATTAQPSDPKVTLNLGGTQVTVDYSFGSVGVSGPNGAPMNGETIVATPQGCSDCSWMQTVTGTGVFATGQKTDNGGTTSPLYPSAFQPDAQPGQFLDKPSVELGHGAGTFNAVTILGTADRQNKTFQVRGAMSYGFAVDSSGHVTGSKPRSARGSELRQAVADVRREFPDWKIH